MTIIPRSKISWLLVTFGITLIIILTTIFSLKSGYPGIFPYFYILPILLLAYIFPRYSVYFTIILGWVYLALVYIYGTFDIRLFAESSAWFYVFVTIGVLFSSKIEELNLERKYREIFSGSQAGIFTLDRETGKITEINEKGAGMLGYNQGELHASGISLIWPDAVEQNKFFATLDREHQISDTEMEFSKKDQTSIWALVTASQGKDATVVCSIVDISERRRMKDILDESEIRYRTLFDFASDAILIHDLDGRIFEANRAAIGIFGIPGEKLNAMTLFDLDRDAYSRIQSALIRDIHTPVTTFVETVFTRKDGRLLPVEISSRPIQYRSGTAIISILRDITERRKAKEALIESEKRYRTLVDQLPDYIIVNRNGVLLYVNPAAARMLGYDPTEITGMTIDRFISPGSMPRVVDAMSRRVSGEPVGLYEIDIVSSDHSLRTVIVKGVLIQFDDAQATLTVLTDITQRKQAEEALRASEDRYRKIGELIPFGVWMADVHGNFTYLSQSFIDLLGLSNEEYATSGWFARLPSQDRDRTVADWKQCVRTGCFWDYEYRLIDETGKVRYILSRGAPIPDSAGKVTSWVGIHFDVTELRMTTTRLETSLREKDVVIKEVHHRVKNNMQVISGFLLLQSQYLTDPLSIKMMEEAQQRVKTMALVHERLYQSRSLEFIDAADYITSLVADLMNSSQLDTHIETRVEVDHININLDMAIPMGLIINELVTNSLKHAFRGRNAGLITVSMHPGADHRYYLTIQDDGVGLPADYTNRSATTLGTQLVRVLVGQLGGSMTVSGKNGTEFAISFPEKF
jgi:PAS domain S-box-containing protein